jgi:hypothetical protein
MPEDTRQVQLPSDLCQRAEQRLASRFGSLEQFLEFVLRELLRDDAAQMDAAEQQMVEQRLKDLGYI